MTGTWQRVFEIVKKEFNQVLRDPRMRTVMFIPPIVQTIIFGFAINMDVSHVRIAWMDRDRTPASRELIAGFEGSPSFEVVLMLEREEEVREALDRGEVDAVIRVLPGFNRDILRGKRAGVQVLVDGADSNNAAIISNHTNAIIARYANRILEEQQGQMLMGRSQAPMGMKLPAIKSESRVWFNPELKSRNFFVPGVLVNIIALVTIMLTAMAIVREKEIGTMEQLMVTPIRPMELILGKTIPFALVGLLNVLMITIAALLIFRIPFRGSCLVLLLSSVLFLLTTLGAGLFISTVSQTQQQALMSTFFFMMPGILLNGFAFPIRNMPLPVQYLTYLNPLRYFIEIVRGIFLKGTGIAILWPQMLSLLIFGIAVFGLSVLQFHKRLD